MFDQDLDRYLQDLKTNICNNDSSFFPSGIGISASIYLYQVYSDQNARILKLLLLHK